MGRKTFENEKGGKYRGVGLLILMVIAVFVFGSCSRHVLTPEEMGATREAEAKRSLKEIEPPEDMNFAEPLTLEEAIRFGLRNNLELRVMDLDRQIQDKETLAQKLQMLPGLHAGANYEYRDKLRRSDVYDWERDVDVRDTTVSELQDSTRVNLSLTWNLLDTILAYVRSGQSEMRAQLKEQQRIRQAQQLALDITEAYWRAAAVEDALDYVHTVENELKRIKENIDRSVADRTMDKMAGAEIELRLKELELTIRQLQGNLSSARLELARLMGLNQNVQFTLARPPIKPIVSQLPHTNDLDIDRLEEFALLNRPELFASDIQVMIQKKEAKMAVLKLFPGLNLFAGSYYDDNRLLHSNTWNTVGAGIGWQLLDIPSNIARIHGTRKSIDMAHAQRLMMTVGVITQVHIALLDYAIKVDRFKLLEDTYQLASNLKTMAVEKNQLGRLPELAVTQRHLEEMAAKLRRDEAVVDLLVAHKRLCVSIGVEPLDCQQGLIAASAGTMELYTASAAEAAPMDAGRELTNTALKKWKCTECGYIHIGSEPPDKCPVCGADRSKFIEIPFEEGAEGVSMWSGEDIRSDQNVASTEPRSRGVSWTDDATGRFLWKVQLGAFKEQGGAAERADQIKDLDLRLMDNRDASVTTAKVHGQLVNRVRILGLTEPQARELAQELKKHQMEYWIVPPNTAHW